MEIKIENLVRIESGTPQFRLKESSTDGQVYNFYNQTSLNNDMTGLFDQDEEVKSIQTADKVITFNEGDIVFSLINGKAALVSKKHQGYLQTRNYLKLITDERIDSQYLVFLLNEDPRILRQFSSSLQGTTLVKFNLSQVKELKVNIIENLSKQRAIGEIYFKQIKVQALKEQSAELKGLKTLEILKGAINNE